MTRRPLCLVCLAFAAVLFVLVRFIPALARDLGVPDGQQIELSGRVYQKEYKTISEETILVLYLNSISISETTSKAKQKQIQGVMCYIKDGKEPPMGALVGVRGKVQCFSKATNPGEFDMENYYRILKLDFRLNNAVVCKIGKNKNSFPENLYRLKKILAATLESCFPQKEASVMKAMLLGEKSELDPLTKQLYQENGIIHILAISGLHISVLGLGVYRMLKKVRLPTILSAVAALCFIWCYGVMTAMSASAFRAIVMFTLKLTADCIGRTYDLLTAVCIAAVLLLIEQPLYLGHAGFLFSFGAVLSIALLTPALIEGFSPASTLAVSLGTLPIQLSYYFQFPVYSILLNLAVLPLMTLVMGLGCLCMCIGGILPLLGKLSAGGVCLVLMLYEKLCLFTGSLPGSIWVTGKPGEIQVFLYLAVLVVLCLGYQKIPGLLRGHMFLWGMLVLTLRLPHDLEITILDVGQGDSIHIQTSNEKNFLVDGGSSSQKDVALYQILPYLKSDKAVSLDTVFITHPDEDHVNGIKKLMEENRKGGLHIGRLVLPDIGDSCRDEAFLGLADLAAENHIPVLYMSSGQYVKTGNLKITALHPPKGYDNSNSNEYSLVLQLEYGGFRGLLTGDVEGEGEERLKNSLEKENKRELTFLKVAHHGSKNSTGREFLKLVKPQTAVISCSKKNRYGHPHPDLISRLIEAGSRIYQTMQIGAVQITTNGKTVNIRGFL